MNNPFLKDNINLTEQARIIQTNPKQAEFLKAEATEERQLINNMKALLPKIDREKFNTLSPIERAAFFKMG
jgi:hypothetical protein